MDFSNLTDTLSQKDLQSYLTKRVYDEQYWPTFFPLKRVSKLDVTTIVGAEGNRVAADIVSYDSKAPLKTRPKTDKTLINIPAIRIARQMSEADLNEYYSILAMADDQAQRDAAALVFDDIDFVVNGVIGRLEYTALQILSYGIYALTTSNNVGVVTEANIDYNLPSGNKEYIGSAGGTAAAGYYWTAGAKATNDPIEDIKAVTREASNAGVKLRYMLMNESKWYDLSLSTNFQNFTRVYLVDGTAYRTSPSLEVVNGALQSLGLPKIVVIDTRVTLETADHAQTSTDPWLHSSADKYVTFLEDLQCGNMLYCPTAEERSPAKQCIYAKKGPILVSKSRSTDPVGEKTVGLLNAMPSWPKIDRAWILNTESHSAF